MPSQRNPVSWRELRRGQNVKFYTANGWKKGTVSETYDNSCSITWSQGSTNKTTRVYDTRNVRYEH